MFLSPAAVRDHEAGLLTSPVAVATALAEAGAGIARIIAGFYPKPGTLWLFLGCGHNAADAIIAGCQLAAAGWTVRFHTANPAASPAPLTTKTIHELAALATPFNPVCPDPAMPRPWIAVDALCGIGARLPLSGPLGTAINSINHWRTHHGAQVLAIDIPSGLDGATGVASDPCVIADVTITIVAVKRGLVLNPDRVGRLVLLELASLPTPPDDGAEILLTSKVLGPWLPPQPHHLHKGQAGRIALIAGSPGMTGAASLMALGALYAGGGLITVFSPAKVLPIIASRCPVEVMTRELPSRGLKDFPAGEFDVIGIGPGCGRTLDTELPGFVSHCPQPLVIDADALAGLARECGSTALPFKSAPAARLLTPHPGEFAALAPDLAGLPRMEAATAFIARFPACTLLLKGPQSLVASANHPLAVNPTGNSGLATGGTGDVLAGVACTLLHRTNDPWRAAAIAAWLHGRSAELTCSHGNSSTESLVASAVAANLGLAFRALQQREG